MKIINRLASFNCYLLEICFPKELLCGTRNKFVCDSSEIGVPGPVGLRVNADLNIILWFPG